jgi:SAM-dependent methyltransferase
MSWVEYWSEPRYGSAYLKRAAQHYAESVQRILPFTPDMAVLDFGAGQGFAAEFLAPRVRELHLTDASESVMQRAAARNARFPNATHTAIANGQSLVGPFAPGSLDVILVNSVLQYLTPEDVVRRFGEFHAILKPHGKVILSDIVTEEHSLWRDLGSVFMLYLRWNMLGAFIRHHILEFSKIGQRASLGLEHHSFSSLEETCKDLWTISKAPNPTTCPSRLCLVLEKRQ